MESITVHVYVLWLFFNKINPCQKILIEFVMQKKFKMYGSNLDHLYVSEL